jgi:hypothetical protein
MGVRLGTANYATDPLERSYTEHTPNRGGNVMTLLADFTHIIGVDGPVGQTDQTPQGEVAISSNFNTGGIRGDRSVMLMFSVKPLGNPPEDAAMADVYINDFLVGSIRVLAFDTPTPQTIVIPRADDVPFRATGGRDNVFALKNVPRPFTIQDIVCFYHQDS